MISGISQFLPREIKPPEQPLPRPLARKYAISLAAVEAVACFASTTFLLAPRGQRVGDGILIALLYFAASVAFGRYRRSFAVYARDEVYYAATVWAAASVPAFLTITLLGKASWHSALLVCLACGVFILLLNVVLANARNANAIFKGTVTELTPEARVRRQSRGDRVSKRIFDLVVASAAAIVFAPVMAAVAIAVLADSGAPVFFRQERVGRNGRIFEILKFRTLKNDAGSQWVRPGDDRITKIGRFLRRTSLDELPQIFNVLRGQMSVVGPRPEMRSFAEEFEETIPHYAQRHTVAPGITGWAQIYLKRNLEPSDMPVVLPYDLFYVEHASRLLDCAIVLKTAFEVLFHRAV